MSYTPILNRPDEATYIPVLGTQSKVSTKLPRANLYASPESFGESLLSGFSALAKSAQKTVNWLVRVPSREEILIDIRSKEQPKDGRVEELRAVKGGTTKNILETATSEERKKIVGEEAKYLAFRVSDESPAFSVPTAGLINSIKNKTINLLVRETNPKLVLNILKKEFPKITPEASEKIAPAIARATTPEAVDSLILGTTKTYAPILGKQPASSISRAKASGQSFDEWVKGRGEIHRGDTTPIKLSEMDTTKVFNPAEKEALSAFNNTPGLYFTDSVSNAKSYGQNLTSVSVSPTAKVINVNDVPKILKRADVEKIIRSNPRIKDWATNWDENFDKAIKNITDSVMAEKDGNEFLKAIWSDGGFSAGDFVNTMKKAGIDGIIVPKEGVNHFVIYNKDILKTKSQLTDFYNKVTKPAEAIKALPI